MAEGGEGGVVHDTASQGRSECPSEGSNVAVATQSLLNAPGAGPLPFGCLSSSFPSYLGGGPFAALAAQSGGEDVSCPECGGGRSLGVYPDQVLVGDVEPCTLAAAGGGDVQRLSAGVGVDEDVRGVDGHALCAGSGGGVAQFDGACDVLGRQPDATAVSVVADGEATVAMALLDGPEVTVLDEVSATSGGQAAVVGAGDDAVADTGEVTVVQLDRVGGDVSVVDAFKPGAGVERCDVAAPGRDQQAGQASASVDGPGLVAVLEHGLAAAGGNPVAGEVEVEGLGAAVAQLQGGSGFVGVGEPVQAGELDGPDVVDQETERSAGLDSRQLGGVTEKPYDGAAFACVPH